MKINFSKYHGTGNDFIMLDDRQNNIELSAEQIAFLCNRHFGIGADGLIKIRSKPGCDFDMIYYNSDGRPGSMCGNGGRCAVAFANVIHMSQSSVSNFNAVDGRHSAIVTSQEGTVIKLKMADVIDIRKQNDFILLDTGSPHYVTFRNEIAATDVYSEGKSIRYSAPFNAAGINVNFVKVNENDIEVRTYERGVEDETLSCGTGVTAAVLASVAAGKIKDASPLKVITPGGILMVWFKKNSAGFEDVWLEGPATFVFEGSVDLP